MVLSDLMVRLRRVRQAHRSRSLRHLCPPDHFRKTIERERARTDRNGDPFSLITFAAREPETSEDTFTHLVKILQGRLRRTDEIGWLDDQHVAAVLPSTPLEGAAKVADDICLGFPDDRLPPQCEIYCYPSDYRIEVERAGRAPRRAETPARSMGPLFIKPLPLGKRCLDVLGAVAGLIVLAPLFVLLAVAIKLTSPGPVLFRQYRAGLGGRRFALYKFRSMTADAEAKKGRLLRLNEQDGPAFKVRRDPRVTRLGQFLRRTCLDELPQLWNVLRGDMTLVGPRPLPCEEAAACEHWQNRRLDVTPGLTCQWQVRGTLQTPFSDWVRMDIRYIESRSLLKDLTLLLLTVPAILKGKGRW